MEKTMNIGEVMKPTEKLRIGGNITHPLTVLLLSYLEGVQADGHTGSCSRVVVETTSMEARIIGKLDII